MTGSAGDRNHGAPREALEADDGRDHVVTTAHAILTRFNMPTERREAKLRRDAQWLEHRFELFERFCLPSVLGQESQGFVWLIYFDSRTPQPFLDRIAELGELPSVYPILRPDVVPLDDIIEHVRERCAPGTTHVITTALDNDDAIARNFVTRLRHAAATQAQAGLNFPHGYVYSDGKTYVRRDLSNAFISMIEPIAEMRTVWSVWHTEIAEHVPVVQVDEEPAWLQVVHGRNVSNRVRGRRVRAAEALRAYCIEGTAEGETALSLRLENMFVTPVRDAREAAWARAKPVVRRVRGW